MSARPASVRRMRFCRPSASAALSVTRPSRFIRESIMLMVARVTPAIFASSDGARAVFFWYRMMSTPNFPLEMPRLRTMPSSTVS